MTAASVDERFVRETGLPVAGPGQRVVTNYHQGVDMGTMDELKGRAKSAAGELTDNDELKDEGKADKASGKVKDAIDAVSDKAKDAAEALRKKMD